MPQNKSRTFSEPHTKRRAKRDRYTPVACNQCKLRKIKCSGHAPCRHCTKHVVRCVYDRVLPQDLNAKLPYNDNDDFCSKISRVQASLDDLLQSIRASSPLNQPATPQIGLALNGASLSSVNSKSLLESSGSTSNTTFGRLDTLEGLEDTIQCLSGLQTSMQPSLSPSSSSRIRNEKTAEECFQHPLWPLSRDEALEAIESFREEVETLYSFVNLVELTSLLDLLYYSAPSVDCADLQTTGWSDIDDSRNIDLLKLVIACAMATRGREENSGAGELITSVEGKSQRKMGGFDIDMKDLAIGAMLSVYYYQIDEITLAWRKIGAVARICLELGLHKSSNAPSSDLTREGPRASKLFWCIYVLDRRYSFMANLPFTFRDEDIDPKLPLPDNSSPFLLPMVTYGRLGARILPALPKLQNLSDSLDISTCTYLGGEIERWIESTTSAQPASDLSALNTSNPIARNTNKSLATYCRIRANQMRLSLYKYALHSPGRASRNQNLAELAVHCAVDNIRILRHLHARSIDNPDPVSNITFPSDSSLSSTSSTPLRPQVQRNFFLVSSVSVLYLAIRNAPHHYSGTCVHEYFAALNLLRSSAELPSASRRLQGTVKMLEKATNSLIQAPMLVFESCASPASTTNNGYQDAQNSLHGQRNMMETARGFGNDCGFGDRNSEAGQLWEDFETSSLACEMGGVDDPRTSMDSIGWL